MDRGLLKKYIKGGCNHAEAQQVKDWIDSDQFDHALLHAIAEDLHLELNSPEISMSTEILQKKISAVYEKARVKRNSPSNYRNFYQKNLFKIAASLLILVIMGLFLYDSLETPTSPLEVTSEIIIKENDKGRKSTIFLPDGSVVNLNSESAIQYDEVNFENNRTVLLSGEAFFEVAKDSIHPFRVVAGQVMVTALGTSFNIDSYDENKKINVALVTGKVLVKNNQDSLPQQEFFLNPGQAISYQKQNRNFTEIMPFSHDRITGWKDGILFFDRDDLPTVMRKLERWFAVDFELLNKSPHTWRYTSQFRNQNLKNILESLSFSQNFNYEIKGKKVYIKFK